MQWGLFTGSGSDSFSSIESQVGQQADIQAIFSGWGDSFPSYYASALCAGNKTLWIYWENYGYSLDGIIAGQYDSYIKSYAQGAANYKCPVVISLFHEMNGNWDSWDGTVGNNSPAKVIAAYKHVHDLFAGVSNVKWAWVVNNVSVPNVAGNQFSDYWPGSAYVDYVGVDGFNFGGQTFAQVFDAAVSKVQTYGKPIYLSSVGSVAGSQKAQWIYDLGSRSKTYPNVIGWIWFNENQGSTNWLINSDTASMTAFKAIVP